MRFFQSPKDRGTGKIMGNLEDGDFECDACDATILNNECSWSLADDAPVHCSGFAFCLCNRCKTKLGNKRICLMICPISYGDEAEKISGCSQHSCGSLSCSCRCAVCNKVGHEDVDSVNERGHAVEKEWAIGKVRAFKVTFTFLLCPNCTPLPTQDVGAKEKPEQELEVDEWVVDGETLAGKWYLPHLEWSVIFEKFREYNQ